MNKITPSEFYSSTPRFFMFYSLLSLHSPLGVKRPAGIFRAINRLIVQRGSHSGTVQSAAELLTGGHVSKSILLEKLPKLTFYHPKTSISDIYFFPLFTTIEFFPNEKELTTIITAYAAKIAINHLSPDQLDYYKGSKGSTAEGTYLHRRLQHSIVNNLCLMLSILNK